MLVESVPSSLELSIRQREILRIVVQQHITTATPVGSSAIRVAGQLPVSTATIRNELAALEELGLIYQPHTSAGRMPTVQGYRYFVEQLMEQVDLPVYEQRMIRHQFHQLQLDLDQWMRLTAAVLAHTSQAAAVVTLPRASNVCFKHLEVISVHDTMCLMILVLQDGSIHQEMLATTQPIDQEALSQISSRLNSLLTGCTISEIEESESAELGALRGLEAQVLQHVVSYMQQFRSRAISRLYSDGLINILHEPEFEEASRFRQVLEVLEHRSLLESIFGRILKSSGVQIIIGGGGDYDEIDDVSLVLSPYGIRGKASGVLGVLGPTRMPYGRAISAVRYIAHLMDSLMADVYGEPDA